MILETKGLDSGDFKNEDEMKLAADKLIEVFNAGNPEQSQGNPPKIVQGFWKLDEFFYATVSGDSFPQVGGPRLMRGSEPHAPPPTSP